jgi:hypothetical protein
LPLIKLLAQAGHTQSVGVRRVRITAANVASMNGMREVYVVKNTKDGRVACIYGREYVDG